MPANTYFDAFGFLKLDYALLPRDIGGWLQGQRPMNGWEWPPGTAQFNHNVPFQTANGMQLFRDLAYFNDAAGRPLFDPYSFIANGRVLPSVLAAAPQVGGVIAYSGHQNGFTHIPLQQALRSTAWFGTLNNNWLATRDRILAENPNATTDGLRSLLRDEALKVVGDVNARLAVLDYILTARPVNGVMIGAIDINNGPIPEFNSLVTPNSAAYEASAKTVADLARIGIHIDAVPFTQNPNTALQLITDREQFLVEARAILDGSTATPDKIVEIQRIAPSHGVGALTSADIAAIEPAARPVFADAMLRGRILEVNDAVRNYVNGTVMSTIDPVERALLAEKLTTAADAEVADLLNRSNAVRPNTVITGDDIGLARSGLSVSARGNLYFGIDPMPMLNLLKDNAYSRAFVNFTKTLIPESAVRALGQSTPYLILLDMVLTDVAAAEAVKYGDPFGAERQWAAFGARNTGAGVLGAIGYTLGNIPGLLLGAFVGGIGGQHVVDAYYRSLLADPKSVDDRVKEMAQSYLLEIDPVATMAAMLEGPSPDFRNSPLIPDDMKAQFAQRAAAAYQLDLTARDNLAIAKAQSDLRRWVEAAQQFLADDPTSIAALNKVIADSNASNNGTYLENKNSFTRGVTVDVVRADQDGVRQSLQQLISQFVPSGLKDGEALYDAIASGWGDEARARMVATGREPSTFLDPIFASSNLLNYVGGALSPETTTYVADGIAVERQDWITSDGRIVARFEGAPGWQNASNPMLSPVTVSEFMENGSLARTVFQFNAAKQQFDPVVSTVTTIDGVTITSAQIQLPTSAGGVEWVNTIIFSETSTQVPGTALSWTGPGALDLKSVANSWQQSQSSSVGGFDVNTLQWVDPTGTPSLSVQQVSDPLALQGSADSFFRVAQANPDGTARFSDFSFNAARLAYDVAANGMVLADGTIVTTPTDGSGPTVSRGASGGGGIDAASLDAMNKDALEFLSKFKYDDFAKAQERQNSNGGSLVGGEIGSILGSSIGNAIAGGNVFGRIAASSVLGTLLQNVGQTFGYMLDQDVSLEQAAYASFKNFDFELAQQIHSAGLGAVSSFLSAELAESLGIHSTDFGGQLFNYAASTGINTILDYAIGNVAQGLKLTDGIGGALFGNGSLPDPFSLGIGFAKFLGGYIAHEIVAVENLGGSIGSQIGGFVGSAIGAALSGIGGTTLIEAGGALLGLVGIGAGTASAAIGSITAGIAAVTGVAVETVGAVMAPFTFGLSIVVATVIGTLLGNALGDLFKDQGFGDYSMVLTPDANRIVAGRSLTDDWDFGKPVYNMRQSALAVTNAVLAAIGGQVTTDKVIEVGFYYNDHPYMRTYVQERSPNGTVPYAHLYDNLHHPDALLNYGVIEMLKRVDIAGGDLYMKRVLANTEAATIEQLMGELQIARDYETYLANKDVIDAIIMLDPTSAFAAGWIITLLKAEELGIDKIQRSDFIGGVNAFLKGFDLERLGATLGDVTLSLSGTTLTLTIAQGFGRGDKVIELADYATLTGLTRRPALTSGALVTGGDADELWIARNVDSTFTDASTRLDTYSNDVLIGGIGNDTINAGVGADYVQGGAGNDSIDAGTGDDIVVGGTGNDTIQGGLGNDVYVFRRGDGADEIRDSGVAIQRTGYVQQFGGTYVVASMDEKVLDTGTTMVKTGTRSETWLVRATVTTEYVFDSDNNLVYDSYGQPLTQLVYHATTDAQGHYILAGAGWTGPTTTVVQENIDVYTEQPSTLERTLTVGSVQDGGRDVIQMGQGITRADLVARVSGSDLILALRDSANPGATFDQLTDRMTLVNWMSAASRVESIVFADGSGLDTSGILSLVDWSGDDTITFADTGARTRGIVLDAGAGNDIITTGDGNDVITGGAGTDTISTGAGNDVIHATSGADHIDGGAGTDTLDYGSSTVRIVANLNTGVVYEQNSTTTDTVTGIENVNGSGFNDTLTGNASANALWGRDGNDSLNGAGGNDTLYASAGADTLNGSTGVDLVDYSRVVLPVDADGQPLGGGVQVNLAAGTGFSPGNLATDTLLNIEGVVGSVRADTITGNSGANTLRGLGGNDTIDGGGGRDTIEGGAGNDVVIASLGGDNIDGGDGFDTVDYSGMTGAISVDLTPVGDGDWIVAVSDASNTQIVVQAGHVTLPYGAGMDRVINVERIVGTAYADTMIGNSQNNVFDGGAGSDSMSGGVGDDVYYVDSTGDVVTEDLGAGTDEIRTTLATFTLSTNDVENLSFVGTGAFVGTGNALNNVLTGGTANDTLSGGSGNDTLDGAAGADSLIGGTGNDVYIVDNSADVVTEAASGGTDEVRTTLSSYAIADNVENLTYTGNTSFTGTGNALGNVINGGSGQATLAGGAGNDTYIVDSSDDLILENAGAGTDLVKTTASSFVLADNVENLTYIGTRSFTGTGNASANTITGGDGNDTLDGGTGADSLIGGLGDDTYIIDSTSDSITEVFGQGNDEVRSSLGTVSLASGSLTFASIERLTYTGNDTFNGTGNIFANTITGGAGNDTLSGGAGDDTLVGGAGADNIDGGAGSDTADYSGSMAGVSVDIGTGSASGGDAEGDTLIGIENLRGSALGDALTGNTVANKLIGGDGNDTLDGGTGADTLIGGRGDDTFIVDNTGDVVKETDGEGTDTIKSTVTYSIAALGAVENLTLTGTAATSGTGNALDNVLVGNSASNTLSGDQGNDTLNGGAGADVLLGGSGDDVYYVDNSGDVIDETGGDGTDMVRASISFSLADANHAKGDIENLTLTGAAAINATGNALANALTGNAANNVLIGLDGADSLNGGAGADTLIGGTGDDCYTVDNVDDVITETADGGSDTVMSSLVAIDLAQYANVENATLTGIRNLAINGTAGDNTLIGNSGSNTIIGGAGNDVLAGLGGADHLDGGDGTSDTASYEASTAGVDVSLATGINSGGDAAGDTLANIENLTGSSFDDTLEGDGGDNVLTGGSNGGGGDTASYEHAAAGVKVSLALTAAQNTLGAGTDTLSEFENLVGSAFNDSLTGSAGANTINGADGDDTINGGAGSDMLIGGNGNDIYTVDTLGDVVVEMAGEGLDKVQSSTIDIELTRYANVENATLTGTNTLNLAGTSDANVLTGNASANVLDGAGGDDTLNGGLGDDRLLGGAGDDRLVSGDGNDTLRGGAGSDNLYGQAGSDTYVLGHGDGQDTIYNQDDSAATDTLHLEGFTRDTVWLVHKGNDLYVSIIGSDESVRIVNYYTDTTAMIDKIELDGGQFLQGNDINALVQAMAGYSSTTTGLANAAITASTVPASVQTAIAGAWHSS